MKKFQYCFMLICIICINSNAGKAQTNDELSRTAYKLWQERKIEEAINLAEKVLQNDPANGLAAYTCGMAYFDAQKFSEAEKYLTRVLEVKKDDPQLYATLGSAYYAARADKNLLTDFNKSMDYLEKAIKLDPKWGNPYVFRAQLYMAYYKINGLSTNIKAKEAYYNDMQKGMQIIPGNLKLKYDFANTSIQLGDYAQAIPVFTKLLESPLITKEAVSTISNSVSQNINLATKNNASPKIWNDAIALIKAAKNAYNKFDFTEIQKKENQSFFREKIISYIELKANGVKATYLANPEYFALVNEAIDAGETKMYAKRIEIYTFKKQLNKAEADKKSKLIAEEKDNIDYYVTKEATERQREKDFENKQAYANGGLNNEDFKTALGMKKSRLFLLDKIVKLNLAEEEKNEFTKRRENLIKVIEEGENVLTNSEKRKEYGKKISDYEYEMRNSRNIECIGCDATGAERANYKRANYLEAAIGYLRDTNRILFTIKPEPTAEIDNNLRIIKQRQEEITKMRRGY